MIYLRKAVFLDRDGVINVDKGYVYKIEDFEFIDGSVEAMKKLKRSGYSLIVVTNQSGIGRGYYTEDDVQNLHSFINRELSKEGFQIDDFFYCPHHPYEALNDYKKKCECRKPGTLMLEKAIKKYNIDVNKSYMIGDRISDIKCGLKLGLASYLIRQYKKEYNREELTMIGNNKMEVFDNLSKVSTYILR